MSDHQSQGFLHELTRRYNPFNYLAHSVNSAVDKVKAWKQTFGDDGGQLDTETGVIIDVPRNQTRAGKAARNLRKVSVKIVSETPLKETEREIIATPVVEIKPGNFGENDKFKLELPVSVKVREDEESRENTTWRVMRQDGSSRGFEEVSRSQWQLCEEDSNTRIQINVSQPTWKMVMFAVLRSISRPIWQYVQITVHMSLYGPQQLEQNMCLRALFQKSHYPSLSSDNPAHLINWAKYNFQINDYQKIDLAVEIQGKQQQEEWYINKDSIDAIYREDLRVKVQPIERTIPMTFEPKDGHKPEKFIMTIGMYANEDKRAHHCSFTSPGPNSTSRQYHGNSEESTLPFKNHDASLKQKFSQRSSLVKKHAKCYISTPEMPMELDNVRAKKDFMIRDGEKRENLLSLRKDDLMIMLKPIHFDCYRKNKEHHWDLGITADGEIGFFPSDKVEKTMATKTEGLNCTADNITAFLRKVCASPFFRFDRCTIKTIVADSLGGMWLELARLEGFTTADIDAISMETSDDKEQRIRFLDQMEERRGKHGIHGYLPSLVCGLMKIGMRKLAISVVLEVLFYTIADTVISANKVKEFEKELNKVLSVVSYQQFVQLSESDVKPFDKIMKGLKRCYYSNKEEFLRYLKKALRDSRWENGDFTECEFLTEKVYMVTVLQYHLCSCDMEDRLLL